jgi:aspartyl-tRNA(Asn)/glutamyl-tRNA(Gln) amidotransferase subunit A
MCDGFTFARRSMNELAFLPISELSRLIDVGQLDPTALTRLFLERAQGVGRRLNCFITLCEQTAMAAARTAADRAAASRRLGPLDGIVIALKDNIDVAGIPTSNGFGGPAYRVPTKDAAAVARLRAAGAIILGKLNMHEGALGSTNDNPHFGRTINPHRDGHSPGGSSGGSAAAVAAGLCCAALGSDSGGSVRIPAAYCGIVGLKPSYGLVSTQGVVPLSYRLDHVGPLARTVSDSALMLEVLAGFDRQCSESRRAPPAGYRPAMPGRLDGLRLGVLRNFAAEPVEPAIAKAFRGALDQLTRLGAEIRTVEMPSYDMVQGRRAGFVRVEVEAAFVHSELYRMEPERFSPQMRSYLEWGGKAPATALVRADRRIDIAAFELMRCFDDVDAIVSPTTPQAAPAFADKAPDNAGAFCIPANFAGCPAISVPMGRNELGLPLGLQVIGPLYGEAGVVNIAAAYEKAADLRLDPAPPFAEESSS